MSTRPDTFSADVVRREQLSPHLVRLVLAGPGLASFESTGVPDEWVGLVVPGQFQSRYYTVREWDGRGLVLDVVVHEQGLVTEWTQTDCVGDTVTITAPKGSFALPADARWVVLVGDLTALPAIARIRESLDRSIDVHSWVESPDGPLADYLPDSAWLAPPGPGESGLAAFVEGLQWPSGTGYFWMAGESAQMREIRRHVRRTLGWDSRHHDLMGYWSGSRGRRARSVDPGPIYARGRAAGKSDEKIWAEYDTAREAGEA
ncbi:MAG TPA: siderophore-interacting protein [Marmoricola sp.]|nr:siderophore-interacting protein [Marmoricola sp.]